jgi:uncharacterized protein (TIGR02996 family)
MPDYDFIPAIQENIDDDAPRLVYSDWLEEQGQTARAEFIRVQIDLANLPVNDIRRIALRGRERELLRRHGPEWRKPFRNLVRRLEFRRGFPEPVVVDGPVFLSHSAEIMRMTPIRHLRLNKIRTIFDQLVGSKALDRIPSLEFDPVKPLGARRVEKLLASPHLSRLTALDLSQHHIGQGGLRALGKSPLANRLTALNLYERDLRGQVIPALVEEAAAFGNLAHLTVRDNGLDRASMNALADSPLLGRLQRLELEGNPLVGDDGIAALAGSPHSAGLQRLELKYFHFGEDGLAALIASPHFLSLRELDFSSSGGPRSSQRYEALVNATWFGRLTALSFGTSSKVFVEALAHSPQSRNLTGLRLAHSNLGPSDVEVLARSPNLANLGLLDLTDNEIGVAGARALVSSPYLERLTELILRRYLTKWRSQESIVGEEGERLLQGRFGDIVCQL